MCGITVVFLKYEDSERDVEFSLLHLRCWCR